MNRRGTFRRLYTYLAKRWPKYALGGFIAIVTQGTMQLIFAYMLQGLVDTSVSGDVRGLLTVLAQCSLGLLGLGILIPFAAKWRGEAVEAAVLDMRQEAFEKLQELPLKFHEQTHSGEVVSRLTNDITASKQAYGDTLIQLAGAAVSCVICAAYMWLISWKFAVTALGVGMLPVIFNRYTAKPLQALGTKVQESMASLNTRLKDMLVGMPVVRTFSLQGRFTGFYRQANQQTLDAGLRRNTLQAAVLATNNFLGGASYMALFAVGSYMLITQELSPGEVIAGVQLANGMIHPFSMFGELWVALQAALAGAVRVFAMIDQPGEKISWEQQSEPLATQESTAVSYHDVSFSYDEKPALTGLSLDVPHNSVVALVGPSGGGKSTLFKLLLGFYTPGEGQICLDGKGLAEYGLEELREKISFVPQDAYLFTGTMYQNIASGDLAASEAEVIAAAKAANAHDFIMDLPEGYQTQVGERGTQLSGGQRQRIAIARALLKDAPILLLDEATSALDSESERLVQEALNRLMEGRTTLVIAHRLSTIRNADCICVVADGSVVESGTHVELLELNGIYRKLHDMQLRQPAA